MIKKFTVIENQDKAYRYKEALLEAGYEEVERDCDADFLLTDYEREQDWQRFENIRKAGRPAIVIYPHAARTCWLWDGVYAAHPNTACNFVFGAGQQRVMKAYGYQYPVEPVGFSFCSTKPFKPTTGRRVLFAPAHPNNRRGTISRTLLEANQAAFQKLVRLVPLIELTVRYGGDLEENGLKREHSAQYQPAILTNADSIKSIDQADIIIGFDTFANLAVARGKPTIMFGEHLPAHSRYRQARNWILYEQDLAYPLDLLESDPGQLIAEAASSDRKIQEWRQDFISGDFNPEAFIDLLDKHLREWEGCHF